MSGEAKRVIPAMRFDALTRFYDPAVRKLLPEDKFRGQLLRQARIEPGYRVLDLGCGTASLTLLVKQAVPDARVTGIDADERVLALAQEKARRAGADIALHRASADALPFADAIFERVLTSMVLHHLTPAAKLGALRESWRVLRPGGELHLADWGKPAGAAMWVLYQLVRGFDSWETTRDHQKGLLPKFICEAGFSGVQETARFNTVLGTMRLYAARKPF